MHEYEEKFLIECVDSLDEKISDALKTMTTRNDGVRGLRCLIFSQVY